MLQDPFGRTISYLRLSVTRSCAARCMYCRPASLEEAPDAISLTPAEIEALARHLVANHGLRKLRLTGGEPTSRPDLLEIITRLGRIEGLEDLAMTTNGLTLAEQAKEFAAAGLKRVNISLDSLDREKYERITGIDGLPRALAGIDAAITVGLKPKLNTVVIRTQNDYELSDLLLFASWRKLEIRFIELMPMGPLASKWSRFYVSESEMRQRLSDMGISWTARADTNDPARKYFAGMSFGRSTQVGFITAMSCPFCSTCNRVRITSDGTVYPCLMDQPAGTLLPALRPAFRPDEVDRILQDALNRKAQEHPATGPAVMTEIGG